MEKQPHPQSYEALGILRPVKAPRFTLPALDLSTVAPEPPKVRQKLVGNCLMQREPLPYAHRVVVHELAHGHTEAIVHPVYGWEEVDYLSESEIGARSVAAFNAEGRKTEAEKLADVMKLREKACKRAKTRIRRLVKNKNLNRLFTLTFAENVLDREEMLRHWDVFVKRVRRIIPVFEYVCVFERQKRGAWHAHFAGHRVLSHYMYEGKLIQSYQLLTRLWRECNKGRGGTWNQADKGKNGKKHSIRASAAVAAYITKYVGKDLGDDVPKYGNTYSASNGALPAPMSFTCMSSDLAEGFKMAVDLLYRDITNPNANFRWCFLDGSAYFLSVSPA